MTTTRAGRTSLAINQAMLARGLAPPTVAPVDDLVELCAEIGVDAGGIATFSSLERDRIMVAVARDRVEAVLKIGSLDDSGLRRETEALECIKAPDGTFDVPELLWRGTWGDRYVLAMAAIEHRGIPRMTADDATDLCVSLYRADGAGGPVIHGDLAPWNMLTTDRGLVVLDWDRARFESDPMTDLPTSSSRTAPDTDTTPPSSPPGSWLRDLRDGGTWRASAWRPSRPWSWRGAASSAPTCTPSTRSSSRAPSHRRRTVACPGRASSDAMVRRQVPSDDGSS